jgi:hypothetical protein
VPRVHAIVITRSSSKFSITHVVYALLRPVPPSKALVTARVLQDARAIGGRHPEHVLAGAPSPSVVDIRTLEHSWQWLLVTDMRYRCAIREPTSSAVGTTSVLVAGVAQAFYTCDITMRGLACDSSTGPGSGKPAT